jgi:hypothetical protein
VTSHRALPRLALLVYLAATGFGFIAGRRYERTHPQTPAPIVHCTEPVYHDQAWSTSMSGHLALGVRFDNPPPSVTAGDATVLAVDKDGYVLARCMP